MLYNLSGFLNPQKPHTELEAVAASILKSGGFTAQHKISFNDIACFEHMLNIKIVTSREVGDVPGLSHTPRKDKTLW